MTTTKLSTHEEVGQLEQGDVIKLSLDPTVGHEQQEWRPCIVLSVGEWNSATRGFVLICPLTRNSDPNPNVQPFWIDSEQTDCGISGTALLDQIRSIDVINRKGKKVGRVIDQQVIDDLRMAFCLIMGVDKSFFEDSES